MNDNAEKPIPRATYRLQFNKDFGFSQAARLVPYLAKLGISHLYASPYLKAHPGSTHGYDIVDHNALNPELGTEEDFQAMLAALKANNLGQVLDFVPNHMGVGGADNTWWLDVLEWGQDSPYAGYFDIDWESDRRYLQDKLLVPFLGDQYGAVLESGDLTLRFNVEAGSFAVWAYDSHKLPICPLHYHRILGQEHPELERLGDAFAGLPTYRPHVMRRASELKAELARLVSEQTDIAAAVSKAVAKFNGNPSDPASFCRLHELIQQQQRAEAFEDVVRQCKLHIMEHEMGSELNVLARDAGRIARSNWCTCDFTNNILHVALKEIVARFPVYRTYIDGSAPTEGDRRDIGWAIAQARRAENAPDASVFDFLHALLTADLVAEPRSGYSRHAVVRLAMKVQQYSGPVMAIVAIPRLVATLDAKSEWADTTIVLPVGHTGRRWRNVLAGAAVKAEEQQDSPVIRADCMFEKFPVSVLVPADGNVWSRPRE